MSCNGHGEQGHGHAHGDLEQPLLKGGNDDHGHSHGHAHGGDENEDAASLKKAVYLSLFFMAVELIGGYVCNSLAIMTDAAHMLSDVGGFIISLLGLYLAQRTATEQYTYGFKQAEVLGAFFSILIVWALTAVLLFQAYQRFLDPEPIHAPMMFLISVIGFLVNLVLMKVLGHNHSHAHGEEDENIAIKAAVAHVIGDIVQSLGVCLAAALIWWQPFDVGTTETGVSKWVYADPCCTILFGIMVLATTKETIVFAMDTMMVKAPSHIDQDKFRKNILKIPNVVEIHDFHIWSMGSKETLCTAHIMISESKSQSTCLTKCIEVANSFGIGHSTFQLEVKGEFKCEGHSGLGCGLRASNEGHAHGDDSGHGHDGHDSGHGHDKGHAHDDGHSHGGGGGSDCCGGHGGGHDGGGHEGHGGHESNGGHGGHAGH